VKKETETPKEDADSDDKAKDDKGNVLPKTATSSFNMMLIKLFFRGYLKIYSKILPVGKSIK